MRTVSLEQGLERLREFCEKTNCDGLNQRAKRRVEEILQLRQLSVPRTHFSTVFEPRRSDLWT